MSPEGQPVEGQPVEAGAAETILPYINQFAHDFVTLTAQDDRYPLWSAYTLAVILYADASGETDLEFINRTYSEGLDDARIVQGIEPNGLKHFNAKQWQLFRRIVFGGLDITSSQLSPEELLAGVSTGLYNHHSIAKMAHK